MSDCGVRLIPFYHRAGSDYLDAYGADAAIISHVIGLVLLTVSERHATPEFPAGTSHTAIPLYCRDAWFEELRRHGFEPVVSAEIQNSTKQGVA